MKVVVMRIQDLQKGNPATVKDLGKEAHKTHPPSRYTETSLISKLEALGIGRPATFASIVSIIQERGYVKKVKNRLVPTFKGIALTRVLTEMFPEYTDYGYTSTMEEQLDEIAAGKTTRAKFLNSFWNGKDGFQHTMKELLENVKWSKINELSTIDLQNGYSVKFSRNGAWLSANDAEPNEKGYKPSVRLDDNELVDSVIDPEVCAELLKNAANKTEDKVLGVLKSGNYKDWTVTLKDGKYGHYLQAVSPKKKDKPVNQSLPEGLDADTVGLNDVVSLFEKVKLPRHLSSTVFVGVGKRGAYIGTKKTAKSRRAVFYSLPEEYDVYTVTLEDVEKILSEK